MNGNSKNRRIGTVAIIMFAIFVMAIFVVERQDLGIVCVVRNDTPVYDDHDPEKRDIIGTLNAGAVLSIVDEFGAKEYAGCVVNLGEASDSDMVWEKLKRPEKGYIIGGCSIAFPIGAQKDGFVERRLPLRLRIPWKEKPLSSSAHMKRYPKQWAVDKDSSNDPVLRRQILIPAVRESEVID